MTEWVFGPGEEKLAAAFELIVSLQESAFALKARMDIDTLVLAALIATHPEPSEVLDRWMRMSSESLPEELTRTFSGPTDQQLVRDVMNQRTTFWTEVLHAAANRDDG